MRESPCGPAVDARRLSETSSRHERSAAPLQGPGGKMDARLKILPHEIGKFREHLFETVATGEMLMHRFDAMSQSADDRVFETTPGIDHEPFQQRRRIR